MAHAAPTVAAMPSTMASRKLRVSESRGSLPSFAARVVRWQRAHGRHGLPWQGTRDAYRIWLSEVMLQQTQVATVIPYYERFLARFPTVSGLAAASQDEVLALWSGLGYYARARNLHRAACTVVERHGGIFPTGFADLVELPGVGRSTAGAIAAFAAGERRAILDGNVRRVLARHAGIGGDPSSAPVLAALWSEAEARLPARGIEAYTQGMMDLGADVCLAREPHCLLCPVAADCVARREERIAELPGRKPPSRAPAPPASRCWWCSRAARCCSRSGRQRASGAECGRCRRPMPPRRPPRRSRATGASRRPSVEPLAPFEHAFTHFTLEVTPWRMRARGAQRLAEGRPAAWLALSDLEGAALPSPVRRLLASLGGR